MVAEPTEQRPQPAIDFTDVIGQFERGVQDFAVDDRVVFFREPRRRAGVIEARLEQDLNLDCAARDFDSTVACGIPYPTRPPRNSESA